MKTARQIIRELVEEVIEEMSTSASASVPPHKFAFGGDAEKAAVASMPGGTLVGNKKTKNDNTSVGESESLTSRRDASIVEEGYRSFKESKLMGNRSKAPYVLTQARRSLREAEYLIKICERLMTECGYTKNDMWRRTDEDLMKMKRHLNEIAKGIHRLGKK
jgi:hypothetical protein